jgi:hypothetical protein
VTGKERVLKRDFLAEKLKRDFLAEKLKRDFLAEKWKGLKGTKELYGL